jgi:hypothetical protein
MIGRAMRGCLLVMYDKLVDTLFGGPRLFSHRMLSIILSTKPPKVTSFITTSYTNNIQSNISIHLDRYNGKR